MDLLAADKFPPPDARAAVAASLAAYYSELGDLVQPSPPFSLARLLLAHGERRELGGREGSIIEGAAVGMSQFANPDRHWIPLRALSSRAMATTPGSKGGYLAGVSTDAVADVLRPWSVVAASGARVLVNLRDTVVIPRTATASTASWIGENGAGPSESPPTLGNVSLTPRTALTLIKFSMQLLRQGEAVEEYLRAQLLGAIGEILDQAFFAGAGGAQPLGLLNTTGIGTQSGTSLAHAGVLNMRETVLTAGAREENLAWVGTPGVQETLGARELAAGGGRFLWDSDGILGKPANATKNAPASALVLGDFSSAVVGIFGAGIRIDIDPSQDFNTAGLVARVMLLCDVGFPRPEAFSVASGVT